MVIIDDLPLLRLFNTWSDGSDIWRTAKSGWIYLNLHLGNVARITHTLAAIKIRQGNKFIDETLNKGIQRKDPEKVKDAAFVSRVFKSLSTLYSFEK